MRTPLKILIFSTIGFSLLAALLPQLYSWLALSWEGIERLYLWQFLTYPFVEASSVSLGFLLQLGFNMYILWMFGASLIERSHLKLFFGLYFGATVTAGVASLAIPHGILAGSTPAIYAVLTAWMMLNPGSQLLLFFSLPFKSHWLIVGLIALSLFLDVSSNNWTGCASLGASVLFAYLFTLIVWREQSPFTMLHPFERKILRLLEKKKPPYHHSKIYDIKSGEPILDDDQFMDAMLDRISRHGEESLTAAEKKRMKAISERKK